MNGRFSQTDAGRSSGAAAKGRLLGIGLGPGDPELMTLKASRMIRDARVVAYPKVPGGESIARNIARGCISPGTIEIALEVPMRSERAPAQIAYDEGAARISDELALGNDVAYLCEGDPLLYGSFMYVSARLSRQFEVQVVPGIAAYGAAAALAVRPLVARNEVLTILPAPLADEKLRKRLRECDAAAIMKVGRHLKRLRGILRDEGLEANALYVERASMKGEQFMPLSEAPEKAPYFSMILITKGADPWL